LKNYFRNIQTLLIVVLAVLLFLQRSCSSTPKPKPEVITEVEVRYDTIKVTETKYIPKYVEKTVVDIDTFNVPIDTLTILKDYYAKYYYIDTIEIDSLGTIVVSDTVTRNLISKRDVQSNLLIPTTTVNNTVYLNKRELYGGISVSGQPDQINLVGGELLYRNKRKQAYGFGVGVNPDFQPVYTVRMYWKVGK